MESCCCSSINSKVSCDDESPPFNLARQFWKKISDDVIAPKSIYSRSSKSQKVSCFASYKTARRTTRRCSLDGLRYLFSALLTVASLQYVSSFSKIFTSSNSSIIANGTEPIFVINFDMAAVICQSGSDSRDLRVHDMSALCDGKLDCVQGVGINDENFPYCESGCEAECSGRGACLRDVQTTKCFYNAEHKEDNTDCGDQTCHWLAKCVANPLGLLECKCFDGFVGNGRSCIDVDECAAGLAKCPHHATCVNLPGSYACSCGRGYRLRGSHPSITCEDIDECIIGTHNCEPYEKCQNTDGGFTCVRKCGSGYALSFNGDHCDDVNECAASHLAGVPICDARAKCSNTLGGFECHCENGFSGDGKTCTPVADCTVNENVCDRRADCVSLLKTCVCREGFVGDGAHCQDVNECERGENVCNDGYKCVNIDGGFLCCDAQEDPTICRNREGAFCAGGCGQNAICYEGACHCISGYAGNPKWRCDDIDECAQDVCGGVSERCVNLSGGHVCCGINSDISECQTNTSKRVGDSDDAETDFSVDDHPSNMAASAFNSNSVLAAGGAVAKAQAQAEASVKGRKQSTDNNGENLSANAAEQAKNQPQKCDLQARKSTCPINALCVDGLCKCHVGFGWNVTTKLCEDIDECQDDVTPCDPGRFCVNTVGGYRCCSINGSGLINKSIQGTDLVNCSGINISVQNFRTIDALRNSVRDLISFVDHNRGDTSGSSISNVKVGSIPLEPKNESILIDGNMSASGEESSLSPGARSGRLTTVTYGEWHNFSGGQVIIRRGSTERLGLEFRPIEFGQRVTERSDNNENTITPSSNTVWTIATSIEDKVEPKVIWSDGDEPEDEDLLHSVATPKITNTWEETEETTTTEDSNDLSDVSSFSTITSTTNYPKYSYSFTYSDRSTTQSTSQASTIKVSVPPITAVIDKLLTTATSQAISENQLATLPVDNVGLEILRFKNGTEGIHNSKTIGIGTTSSVPTLSATSQTLIDVDGTESHISTPGWHAETENGVSSSISTAVSVVVTFPDDIIGSTTSSTPKMSTNFLPSNTPTVPTTTSFSKQSTTDVDESNIGLEISFFKSPKQSLRTTTTKGGDDTTTASQISKKYVQASTAILNNKLLTTMTSNFDTSMTFTEKSKIDKIEETTMPGAEFSEARLSTVVPSSTSSHPQSTTRSKPFISLETTESSSVTTNKVDANSPQTLTTQNSHFKNNTKSQEVTLVDNFRADVKSSSTLKAVPENITESTSTEIPIKTFSTLSHSFNFSSTHKTIEDKTTTTFGAKQNGSDKNLKLTTTHPIESTASFNEVSTIAPALTTLEPTASKSILPEAEEAPIIKNVQSLNTEISSIQETTKSTSAISEAVPKTSTQKTIVTLVENVNIISERPEINSKTQTVVLNKIDSSTYPTSIENTINTSNTELTSNIKNVTIPRKLTETTTKIQFQLTSTPAISQTSSKPSEIEELSYISTTPSSKTDNKVDKLTFLSTLTSFTDEEFKTSPPMLTLENETEVETLRGTNSTGVSESLISTFEPATVRTTLYDKTTEVATHSPDVTVSTIADRTEYIDEKSSTKTISNTNNRNTNSVTDANSLSGNKLKNITYTKGTTVVAETNSVTYTSTTKEALPTASLSEIATNNTKILEQITTTILPVKSNTIDTEYKTNYYSSTSMNSYTTTTQAETKGIGLEISGKNMLNSRNVGTNLSKKVPENEIKISTQSTNLTTNNLLVARVTDNSIISQNENEDSTTVPPMTTVKTSKIATNRKIAVNTNSQNVTDSTKKVLPSGEKIIVQTPVTTLPMTTSSYSTIMNQEVTEYNTTSKQSLITTDGVGLEIIGRDVVERTGPKQTIVPTVKERGKSTETTLFSTTTISNVTSITTAADFLKNKTMYNQTQPSKTTHEPVLEIRGKGEMETFSSEQTTATITHESERLTGTTFPTFPRTSATSEAFINLLTMSTVANTIRDRTKYITTAEPITNTEGLKLIINGKEGMETFDPTETTTTSNRKSVKPKQTIMTTKRESERLTNTMFPTTSALSETLTVSKSTYLSFIANSTKNHTKDDYATTVKPTIGINGLEPEMSEKDATGKFGSKKTTTTTRHKNGKLTETTFPTTSIASETLFVSNLPSTSTITNFKKNNTDNDYNTTVPSVNSFASNISNISTTSTPTSQIINERMTTTDYSEVQSRLNATTEDKSSNEAGLEIGPHSKETESPDVGLEIRGEDLKSVHPSKKQSKNSLGETTSTAKTISGSTNVQKKHGVEIGEKSTENGGKPNILVEDGEHPDETTKEDLDRLLRLKTILISTTTETSSKPQESGLEISNSKFPSTLNKSVNAIDESAVPEHSSKENSDKIKTTASPKQPVESTTQSNNNATSAITEGVGLEISGKYIVKSVNKSTNEAGGDGSIVKGSETSGSSHTITETKGSKHAINTTSTSTSKKESKVSSTTSNPTDRTTDDVGLEINGNSTFKKGGSQTTAETNPTTEGVGLEISGKNIIRNGSTANELTIITSTVVPKSTAEEGGFKISGKDVIGQTKSSVSNVEMMKTSLVTPTVKPRIAIDETTEENVEHGLKINGRKLQTPSTTPVTTVAKSTVTSSRNLSTTNAPLTSSSKETRLPASSTSSATISELTITTTPIASSVVLPTTNQEITTTSTAVSSSQTSEAITVTTNAEGTESTVANAISSTIEIETEAPTTTTTVVKQIQNVTVISTSKSIESTTIASNAVTNSLQIPEKIGTTEIFTIIVPSVSSSSSLPSSPSETTEPIKTVNTNVATSATVPEKVTTESVPSTPPSLSSSSTKKPSIVYEISTITTKSAPTTEIFTIHVPNQMTITTTEKSLIVTDEPKTNTSTSAVPLTSTTSIATVNTASVVIDHGEKTTEENNSEDLIPKSTTIAGVTSTVVLESTASANMSETLTTTLSSVSYNTHKAIEASSAQSVSTSVPSTITSTVPSSTSTISLSTTKSSVHKTENTTNECQSNNECGTDAHCDQQTGFCHCNTGFRGQPPSITCADVDECKDKSVNCHPTAQCQNAISGYMCVCPSGYRKDGDGSCKDIDECSEQGATALCAESATCENLPGFYACRCNAGFTGDGYKCVESGKRACTPAEWTASDCGRNHLCNVDAHGRIDCETCKRGFRIINGACADIDECEEPAGSAFENKCHADARCVNIDGGYTCQCAPGYAGDGFHCEDIDECNAPMASSSQIGGASGSDLFSNGAGDGETKETGEASLEVNGSTLFIKPTTNASAQVQRCHPKAECHNTPGAFECRCTDGWLGDGVVSCAPEQGGPQSSCDVTANGCGSVGNVCYLGPSRAVAANSGELSSLRVICECRDGFRYNPVDGGCVDVDECTEQRDVCERAGGAVCRNLEGGYVCECTTGYEGANGNCRDVDECARSTADCHANAYCVNSPGGYSCHCAHGYRGDGVNCSPINPPQLGETTAKTPNGGDVAETKASECPDNWMAYCRALNKTCHIDEEEVAQCGSCLFGYQPINGRCRQIDELGNCADPSKNNCDVNAECIDVNPGRHFCTCNEGFIGDGLRCDDVNECMIPGLCDSNATCRNSNGTYECKCRPGYQGNGFQCKESPPVFETNITQKITTTPISTANCRRNPTVCHPNAFCDWDGICQCVRGFKGDGIYYCNKVTVTDIDEKSIKKLRENEDELTRKQTPKAPPTSAPSSWPTSRPTQTTPSTQPVHLTPSYPRCGAAGGPSDGRDISGYVEIPIDGGAKCHALATCDFSRGDANGGICVCNSGYEGDGYTTCTPLWKDCRADPSICHYYAKCDNRTGDCLCNEGFLGDGINSCLPDSWDCESRGTAICNVQATCVNRRCTCRPGLIGDGITCMPAELPDGVGANCLACHCHARCNTAKRRCECIEGYFGNGVLCVPDPMNCVHYPALCHPAAKCNNGTGACQCQNGYSGDGRICRRVTTCLTNSSICGANAHCLQSGNCRCNDGYFGDGHACTPAVRTTTIAVSTTVVPVVTTVIASTITTTTVSKTTTTVPLIESGGDLGVECLADGIRVHVINTTALQHGARVYLQGHSSDPHCSKTFSPFNQNSHSNYFDVSSAHCNIQRHSNNTISVTVILQKHAALQTAEAVAYQLSCSYWTPPTTAIAQINVTDESVEPETFLIAGAGPPPTCTLTVTSAQNGALATVATVGEILQLSLSVEPRQIYAVLPRNCYAINLGSGERYALTDSAGCAVDTAIFPEWSRALFRTFKWRDTSSIRFECDCSACVGICPTVNCGRRRNATADYRRRMRLRFARQNADAQGDNVTEPFEAEDARLVKFVRRGARSVFSPSVDVNVDAELNDMNRFILGDKNMERHALSAGTIPWLALACSCLIVAVALFSFFCLCGGGGASGRRSGAKVVKSNGWRRAMASSSERSFGSSAASTTAVVSEGDNRSSYVKSK